MSLRSGKDLSLTKDKEAHDVTLFCQKAGGEANVVHRMCCPSGIFYPYYLLLSHLHYRFFWGGNNDIIKDDGLITTEFYTIKFGFEVLGDNIKVSYKQGRHYRG